ncbi:MAG: insulinase family protein, partial [Chloroflexi bacterium]|nr:insulinase family protein [Chloroflexota bacterium]
SHPYHYSASGDEESVAAITPDDLRRFHAERFGPRDMILVIVGAVAAAEAVELASAAFGDWRQDGQPAVRQVDRPAESGDTGRHAVVVPGKTQSDISMGCFGPARLADDYLSAQLANSILGEFGMMGRIGKSVREEKGLAYYAYSRLGGGHGPEPWTISAGVNPENVDLAIASVQEEIERLTIEPVSDEDLADNQSYFTGRMPLRLESNEGIASDIHGMESFGLGLDYLANYEAAVYRIGKEDLLAAARRYLGAGDMVIAVAGPARDGAAK